MANRATPTALKLLRGNPGRRRIADEEPEGVGDVWSPPAWLDDQQRAQWDYAVAHAPPGLLTGTDRELLVIWVVASVEHARACEQLRTLGQIVQTKDGNAIQNPYMAIVNKQAFLMMRAGHEMGFSPASRASLGQRGMEPSHGSPSSLGQPRNSSRLSRYLDQKPDKLDS